MSSHFFFLSLLFFVSSLLIASHQEQTQAKQLLAKQEEIAGLRRDLEMLKNKATEALTAARAELLQLRELLAVKDHEGMFPAVHG